jgi:flagellar protein FliS
MSSAYRAAAAYRTTQVESRSPLELVVMLYDGLSCSLSEAREALSRSDLHTKRTAVSRSLGILDELQNTLDLERGGQIAARLQALYVYVSSRLLEANANAQVDGFDEALRLMAPLREAWATIAVKTPAAQKVSA